MQRMRRPHFRGSHQSTTVLRVSILCALAAAPSMTAAQDTIRVIVLEYNKDSTYAANQRDSIRRAGAAGRVADQARHMGELHLLIPEYHDEQQFQTSDNTFGPMVYIYASPFLGAYKSVNEIAEQGTYGTFAALVEVDAPSGTVLPAEYTNLNLTPGENCV